MSGFVNLLGDGSPLTSKRVWAFGMLCLTLLALFVAGMDADELFDLAEVLSAAAISLIVGESITDTARETVGARLKQAPGEPQRAPQKEPGAATNA